MIVVALVFGLAAGACFAVGGLLQQSEASSQPESESLSPRLLLELARRPRWLAGIGSTAGSFLFKSVALAFGPLTVVQPLIASELVFAIPVSVRREGFRLGFREWSGIVAVTGGLAVGIYAAAPRKGTALPSATAWAEALSGLAVLAVVSLLVARRMRGPARASLYALAAVATLVAQSALLTETVALFRMGLVAALTSWEPYAMGVVSILALTLVQSAYQAGPLAESMPVMDAANPVLGIIVGLVIFRDSITTSGWNAPVALLGVALLIAGVIVIDTSPLVLRVQRAEHQARQRQARPHGDGPADGGPADGRPEGGRPDEGGPADGGEQGARGRGNPPRPRRPRPARASDDGPGLEDRGMRRTSGRAR